MRHRARAVSGLAAGWMRPAPISRRGVIAAPIVLAGCGKRSDYFGNAAPPPRRVFKFALGPEPTTLDPGNYAGDFEVSIPPSVFEGLTSHDPQTVEPTAGLATHYETNSDDTRIQFFLRGHRNPRGTRLRGGDRTAPARWTDGAVITAHDFVYSWRRIIDPATAAPYAYMLYGLRNARDIQRGTKRAHQLGVSAPDDFTFNVEFDRPSPLFLKLTGSIPLSAVPRQAIEAAERRGRPADWIEPENMVSSGAFRLKEWRPHERVILERNRHYYDADMVSLDEIHFLSVARPGTIVNLYQSGEAHSMPGERLPAQFASVLEGRHDFHVAPAVFGVWSVMNTTRPPCDDPLVRYAINMAIDKQRFASVFGSGRTPARTFV